MLKVFISHSKLDQDFAVQLATSLGNIHADVWIDAQDIPAGVKWSTAIQQGLEHSELLIVILSPDSMASNNVEDEWQYFLDQKKRVIPILYRPTQIHFQLSRLQYINFTNKDYDSAFKELYQEIRRHGFEVGALSDTTHAASPLPDRPVQEPLITKPDTIPLGDVPPPPSSPHPLPVQEALKQQQSEAAPVPDSTSASASSAPISPPVPPSRTRSSRGLIFAIAGVIAVIALGIVFIAASGGNPPTTSTASATLAAAAIVPSDTPSPLPPSATPTDVPPTPSRTSIPPSATLTPVPPTETFTSMPPSDTPIPSSATASQQSNPVPTAAAAIEDTQDNSFGNALSFLIATSTSIPAAATEAAQITEIAFSITQVGDGMILVSNPTSTVASTSEPTISPIPSPTPVPTSVELIYDSNTLTLINHSNRRISVASLTFTQRTVSNGLLSFLATQWANSGQALSSMGQGDCYQLWITGLTLQPVPAGCTHRLAWRAVGPTRWFWLSAQPDATFEVRRGSELVATCSVSAGECAFDL